MNLSFNDIVGVACRLHIQLPTYSDTCQSIICGNASDLKVNTLFYVHKLCPFQMPSSLNVPICFCLANCGTTTTTKNSKRLSSWTQPLAAALWTLRPCVMLICCCPMSYPGPIGSMSSMEVNVDMLEQMDLMDMSDHEALDVFLHSGGEDNSAASPVTGRWP